MVHTLIKPNATLLQVLLYLLPFCLTFYLSIYLLWLNSKKGIGWNILSFLVVFFVMSGIGYLYIYVVLPSWGIIVYSSTQFEVYLEEAMLGYAKYFLLALLYFYVQASFKKDRRLRDLQAKNLRLDMQKAKKELEISKLKHLELRAQQEKLQYEYAFLRAQINPHFLHNTLNLLFSDALNYSQELADNIMKLSTIMRYSIESLEYDSGKVMIQKELDYLRALIEINNLRFDGTKNIIFEVRGNIEGHMIPPLAFITIVENAFKYGDLKDPKHPLKIAVELKSNEVSFSCRNKKKSHLVQDSSLNIGMSNLKKRLDVAFKDKYFMDADNGEEFYNFELKIKK